MKRFIMMLVAVLAIAVFAFGCKKEENVNTDTASVSTSASATDTSSTTSTSATGTTASAMSEDDKKFVMAAANGGMMEVKAGEIAASNATNADVKAFGQRMVTDHGKANDELKQLATNKGLALPTDIDADHQKKVDDLSKKKGKAFDKAYMDDMVKDHEKDVAEFQKESTSAQDPDLKAWVTKTLPTLQDHLKMAKETQKKVK